MCGIAGIVSLNGARIGRSSIEIMTRMVVHRGPDGEGIFLDGNLGLGHRRLAIVDPSSDGLQPMTTRDGRHTVVFNGEIYNYIELRAELQALGHAFSTRTDTEVLLASYAEWGTNCVRRFNGMWAFALYDRINRQLFCSRDRFGEKPFYFLRSRDWFAFGSEIRQLLPLMPRRRANPEHLLKFIVANLAEGVEQSFFEGVSKLPAGHNLTLDVHSGQLSIERYYELTIDRSLATIDSTEAMQRFSVAFAESIRLRLRADVPVGTCLSGGLDSSSVATLAANFFRERTDRQFAAITACSEQRDNDESDYAAQVVGQSRLSWHKIKPSYDDFATALPAIVDSQEEPFPSASIAMQYFLMQVARKHSLPVLLDGQGGDELLLGYDRYFAAHYLSEARSKGWISALAAMRASSKKNTSMSAWRVLGYFAYFASAKVRWRNYQRRHSYLRNFPDMFDEVRLYADACGDIHALQKLEIERTNLPALLRYEDKNAMRHSIETRLPFLDHRLVELALSLPGSTKISAGWTKHVLRKAMEGKLPDSIVWRRNKFGFEAPKQQWYERHLPKMHTAVVESTLLTTLCEREKLIGGYRALDLDTQWRLYGVACWEKAFNIES